MITRSTLYALKTFFFLFLESLFLVSLILYENTYFFCVSLTLPVLVFCTYLMKHEIYLLLLLLLLLLCFLNWGLFYFSLIIGKNCEMQVF